MKVVGSGDDPQCLYDSSGMLWDQTSKEFTEKRWPFVVQAKTAVDKLTDLTNGNNHGMQVRVVTPEDENNGGDKAGVYLYNVHWVSEKTGHILFIDKEEIWQQQNNSNLTEDQQEIKALLKQANTMETGKYFHLPDWPSKTFVTKTWRGGQILESATVVSDGLNVGEQVTREELACAIAEAELEAETNIRFPRDNRRHLSWLVCRLMALFPSENLASLTLRSYWLKSPQPFLFLLPFPTCRFAPSKFQMAAKLEALKPQIYADVKKIKASSATHGLKLDSEKRFIAANLKN
eukprot:GHVT01053299.1.p1 GENE.GHVT01053299.1~~GHVT01053299.1.p1  ORF type:complete len:291 (+),score=36.02 GHVT01053299.1:2-874(+)